MHFGDAGGRDITFAEEGSATLVVAIVRYLACVAFDTVFTKILCNRAPPIRALVFCHYLSDLEHRIFSRIMHMVRN